MRGMIFAAGRGERLRPLTDNVPKPLLKIANRYLIEYSIESLVNMGIQQVVINVCYRAEQIKQVLGQGERYGIQIHYSDEIEALETGGGIYQALPLLGKKPFVVMSSDIITDYPLKQLPREPEGLAHIVLVDNPSYHPRGDFSLSGHRVFLGNASTLTFSNIGVYRPELFADCQPGKFRLGTLLRQAILQQQVTGEYFNGTWHNIGTPEDLAHFERMNRNHPTSHSPQKDISKNLPL